MHGQQHIKIDLSCLPVCPSAWNNSAPTGRIFMKSDEYFPKMSTKFKFNLNLTRKTCTLHGDICTFIIILSHFFLERELFQEEVVAKSKHILCSVNFLRKSCRLRDVEKYGTAGQVTDENTIRRMRTAF